MPRKRTPRFRQLLRLLADSDGERRGRKGGSPKQSELLRAMSETREMTQRVQELENVGPTRNNPETRHKS